MLLNILAITLPTLTVLVGILLNQNGLNRLDTRITYLESSLRGEMAAMRGEIITLRSAFHSDVVMLLERDTSWNNGLPVWSEPPSCRAPCSSANDAV